MELADLQQVCSACTAFPAHRMQYGSVVVRAEPQKGKQKINLLALLDHLIRELVASFP